MEENFKNLLNQKTLKKLKKARNVEKLKNNLLSVRCKRIKLLKSIAMLLKNGNNCQTRVL